ncbi:MAG: hypothetical protein RJP95_00245 [Pirellulales bacterium]
METRSVWWLSGQEFCEFCCQEYALGLEYRCIDCDLPICPLCVVIVEITGDVSCPHCNAAEEEK